MLARLRRLFHPAPREKAPAAAIAIAQRANLATAFEAYQAADYASAQSHLDRYLDFEPADAGALQLLAACHGARSRHVEAVGTLRRARAAAPESFEIVLAMAQAAKKAGDKEVSLEAYREASRLRPGSAEVQASLADICAQVGRIDEAIASYRRAVTIRPDYSEAHLNLGRIFYDRRELPDARRAFEAALELNPGSAKGHYNLGLVHDKSGEVEASERAYRRALEIDPAFEKARINLGVSLFQRGAHDEAIAELKQCDPRKAVLSHFNLGFAAAQWGDQAVAERHCSLAAKVDSDDLEMTNDMGILMFNHGRTDMATPLMEHAVTTDPSFPMAQWNMALISLALGRLEEGWKLYEWRFNSNVDATPPRPHAFPRWQGEPLQAKRLLVWGEQGIGDELLFASMFNDLHGRVGELSIEVNPKLRALFARSFPWARTVSRTTPPAEALTRGVDYQSPAGSLARFLRPALTSFPRQQRYLIADPGRVAHWQQRIAALGAGLKIGFSWRSSVLNEMRALSCTTLDQWGDLFAVPGCHWICLQYDDCEDELAAAADKFGVTLTRFPEVDYFDDLDEVAALMCALDLVLSAPTTVSVQSAALGIETWQMSYGGDWQTHGTDHNPWLPAIVRFQRPWNKTWRTMLSEIAERLRARIGHADSNA